MSFMRDRSTENVLKVAKVYYDARDYVNVTAELLRLMPDIQEAAAVAMQGGNPEELEAVSALLLWYGTWFPGEPTGNLLREQALEAARCGLDRAILEPVCESVRQSLELTCADVALRSGEESIRQFGWFCINRAVRDARHIRDSLRRLDIYRRARDLYFRSERPLMGSWCALRTLTTPL
ncbi:MAG: hypothetical protein V4681_04015 [Patescibacteria group bacterium]